MRGPLAYVGGKNRLAKVILPRIPPHVTYVEPFVGGGQIFFHKPRSKVEILNDLDSGLLNFYRVCQYHHGELIRSMQQLPVSRELFDCWKAAAPEGLTDIHRAARYFYTQKLAYGGRVTRKAFGIHVSAPPNLRNDLLERSLSEAQERLSGVQLEHLPYQEVIERYDRPSTFFYLDPPYYDIRLYHYNLEHGDFENMATQLAGIKGKFLLSLNDHAEVRRLFRAFKMERVPIAYSVHGAKGKRHHELLISNY